MLRLVKGAYWDAEIKRAQVDGLPGYPVFTRKVHTDVAYLACAKAMLAAPDAIYPQFASHNAFTIAAVARARRRRAVRVPVPARDGREHLRRGRRQGEARSRLPHLRAGRARTRRCSRTSCGACSRTAPTARSSTASSTRRSASHRSSSTRSPSREATGGAPQPAIPLPVRCCRAAAIRRASTSPTTPELRAALAALAAGRRRVDATRSTRRKRGQAQLRRKRGIGREASDSVIEPDPFSGPFRRARVEIRNPADRDDIVGTVVEATADDVGARRRGRGRARGSAWSRLAGRPTARPASSALPICSKPNARRCSRSPCARRERPRERGGRGARAR